MDNQGGSILYQKVMIVQKADLEYAIWMPPTLAKILLAGFLIATIIGIGIFETTQRPTLEESVRSALREIGMDRTYGMHVETHVIIGDRDLFIDGDYHIDAPENAYASYATTTLRVHGSGETHSFSLGNTSIGNQVWVSVTTESELLQVTLPVTNGWRSFDADAIPEAFAGVAIHGPILDTALLFSADGTHLAFVETLELGEETRYVFTLADPSEKPGGTLQTLFERIGDGTVSISFTDNRISHVVFSGNDYTSTTTFESSISPIIPPL